MIILPIKEGTVTKSTPERGFGFIRPREGGPDVFFHVANQYLVIDLHPGGPDFARRLGDGVMPPPGTRVFYRLAESADQKPPSANPWGLAGNMFLPAPSAVEKRAAADSGNETNQDGRLKKSDVPMSTRETQ